MLALVSNLSVKNAINLLLAELFIDGDKKGNNGSLK